MRVLSLRSSSWTEASSDNVDGSVPSRLLFASTMELGSGTGKSLDSAHAYMPPT